MTCCYKDCNEPIYVKECCKKHYFAEHRFNGITDEEKEKFWAFVKKELKIQ